MVKTIKETKCECCQTQLAPTVFQVDNRMYYYSNGFGYIEYDPTVKHNLRQWDIVDANGVFWDESPIDWYIKQSWRNQLTRDSEEILPELFDKVIANLIKPFEEIINSKETPVSTTIRRTLAPRFDIDDDVCVKIALDGGHSWFRLTAGPILLPVNDDEQSMLDTYEESEQNSE